jgi:hypothetical protein
MPGTIRQRLLAGKPFPNLLPLQRVGWPAHLLATGRLLQAASSGPRGRCPSHGALWEGHGPLCPISLRAAGTPSLPDLSGLARAPGHRVWLQVPQRRLWSAFPCGPRGRGPSQRTLWEGHSPLCPIFLRTAGTPSLPTCRSLRGRPGRFEQPGVVILQLPGPAHLSGRGFGKRGFRG